MAGEGADIVTANQFCGGFGELATELLVTQISLGACWRWMCSNRALSVRFLLMSCARTCRSERLSQGQFGS